MRITPLQQIGRVFFDAFRSHRLAACLLIGCGAALATQHSARASGNADEITSVTANVTKGYVRTKLPDGSFQVETYGFANGGHWKSPFRDETIDKMSFSDIARIIAVPLAKENYLPAKDLSTTKLAIVVYWGTTDVPPPASQSFADQQMAEDMTRAGGRAQLNPNMDQDLAMIQLDSQDRDQVDLENANILGYDLKHPPDELDAMDDLIRDIEENRYFVVLMAYDFQELLKHKAHKLLWATRYSVKSAGKNFDKALPAMTLYASQYFGQDSHGLIRKPIPMGHVEVGTPTVIDSVDASKK